jgi:hypothetical protein
VLAGAGLRLWCFVAVSLEGALAQERVKDAAYDAVEKVLTGMLEPLSRQALTERWNQAVEAIAKHLKAQDTGTE